MRWTTSKIRRLREIYRCMSNPEIGAEFGISPVAVQTAAQRLGLRKVGPAAPVPTPPKEADVIARLRYRVEELEDLMGTTMKMPAAFGLTPLEMKYVGALVRREILSRDALFSAVYGGLSEGDQPLQKTVEVHISKIRRKLLPQGYTIHTAHNVGYYMDAKARSSLKFLCEHRVPA